MTAFSATVLQNEYLPPGGTVLHAVVIVSAREAPAGTGSGGVRAAGEAVEVIMLDCSGSMAKPPLKIEAAHTATCKAIDKLRDGTWFGIVAGSSFARQIFPQPDLDPRSDEPVPSLAQASAATRAAAKEAVGRLRANGGTAISTWLGLARELFETRPGGIQHALLLTDGRNESETTAELKAELERCLGRFQCDCRGVGTDWERAELQMVSDALLGSTDIIPHPWEMDAVFETIMEQSMGKQIGSLMVEILTPVGGGVRFFKQVSPEVLDLSDKAVWQQPAGPGQEWEQADIVDAAKPLLSIYPTGAWGSGDEREYHLCLGVSPQEVGEEFEVRAGRVNLVVDGITVNQAAVRAIWSDDPERFTPIEHAVAHHTGQEELAQVIEEGLEAKRTGDHETATRKLGRAAALAHLTGNEGTTRLLRRVVEIEDAARGTVKLRTDASKEDEMTLDTRSRKTVRLRRANES